MVVAWWLGSVTVVMNAAKSSVIVVMIGWLWTSWSCRGVGVVVVEIVRGWCCQL